MTDGVQQAQGPRSLRLLRLVEGLLSGVLVVAVLGLVAFQVVTRYVLNAPVPWSEELARFALVWLTFIGAGYVMARGTHVTVVVGSSMLGKRGAAVLDAFGSLVVVAVCAVLLANSIQFLQTAGRTSSPAAGISMSYVYGAAVVGFVLIAIHAVHRLVDVFLRPEHAGANRVVEVDGQAG